MAQKAYTQPQCSLIGSGTIENRINYLSKVISFYIDEHQHMCQEADRQDLKQEVIWRLYKIMPESFESERHFKNWCQKFTKLYSINAFRDLCTKWKRKGHELLVGDYSEQIVEKSSCQQFFSKENLNENCYRKYIQLQNEGADNIEIARMLAESKSPASDMAERMHISKRAATERLKKKGFRTKRLTSV